MKTLLKNHVLPPFQVESKLRTVILIEYRYHNENEGYRPSRVVFMVLENKIKFL